MVADYFTKPLQGKLFKVMRDYIMGTNRIPIEERVGNQNEKTSKIAIGTKFEQAKKNTKMTYADALKSDGKMNGSQQFFK